MNKIIVIIINGAPTSGKDTFIKCCERINGYDHCTKNLSSISFINQYMKFFGWDGVTKDDDYRNLISHIKQYAILHGDIPTINILDNIMEHRKHSREVVSPETDYIFVHIREISEIEKMVKILSGLSIYKIYVRTLYIDNNDAYNKFKPNDKLNSSDCDALSSLYYDYDYVINNDIDGKYDKLREQAQKFINDITEDINGSTNS